MVNSILRMMHNYKTVALIATTVALSLISYVLAKGAAPESPTNFEGQVAVAQQNLSHRGIAQTTAGADEAVAISEKAVGNRKYTRAVAKEAATRSYSSADPSADVQFQILLAMQNQKLIEQNERIISLLEKQSKAK
ncbi:hypothetical protein EON83_19635 [bacterium]|nr:MAG: hypothetical protein EON83_19635 [bacterium]